MKATDDLLRTLFARAGASHSRRSDCPTAEVVARAAEAPGCAETEGIVDHLALCSDCAGEYRLALALRPWADGASLAVQGTVRPPTTRAGRPRLLAAILASAAALYLALGAGVLTLQRQRSKLRAEVVAAAEHLRVAEEEVRLAGEARGQVQELRHQLDGFNRLHTSVSVVDLFPSEATRGGETPRPPAVLGSETTFVVLLLNLSPHTHQKSYFIELANPDGTVSWSGVCARRGDEALTIGLPAGLLSGATYDVRVYASAAERRRPLQQYSLRVLRP